MERITQTLQGYAWGSPDAIQQMLGIEHVGPLAEAWFGAHPMAPATTESGRRLDELVAENPVTMLGSEVVARFGPSLPYLLKLIAADSPLSLQVHPSRDQARAGFEAEDAAGIARDDPRRNYRDRNHKPELVYALTPFEAMCGFRSPRQVVELLTGLDAPLARSLADTLGTHPAAGGIRAAFGQLLDPMSRPHPQDVAELAAAAGSRLSGGSPSSRPDSIVVELQRKYPGDPGVAASLLLNPVTLQPGEAMFVPAGGVHAYLRGFGIEIMASSDNVLRAGLTGKHVDVRELLRNVDYVAAPPTRVEPDASDGFLEVFRAPVDDFKLSVVHAGHDWRRLPGIGPRIVLCIEGTSQLSAGGRTVPLGAGQAVFVPAQDGALDVAGAGVLVQVDVP